MSSGTGAGRASGTVVDAKTSLALWLRAGRCQKGLTIDEVARKTKIQARIIEQLESGKLEGLPADVFVRGFVRSIAKCVGLDEDEALRRYGAIGLPSAPVAARALIESMSDLAPSAAQAMPRVLRATPEVFEFAAPAPLPVDDVAVAPVEPAETFLLPAHGTLPAPVVEAVVETAAETAAPLVEVKPAGKKPRARRGTQKTRGGKRKALATGTPSAPSPTVPDMIVALPPAGMVEAIAVEQPVVAPVVVVEPVVEAPPVVEAAPVLEPVVEPVLDAAPVVEAAPAGAIDWSQPIEPTALALDTTAEVASSGTWAPKMPTAVPPSTPPWRRPTLRTTTSTASTIPRIVIDDADPESAERELEDRAADKDPAPRRSFLPPILRDLQDLRDDRSERQGGLTLAVIILLIAATLTLSYLMRRPSSSGDGVTVREPASQLHVG